MNPVNRALKPLNLTNHYGAKAVNSPGRDFLNSQEAVIRQRQPVMPSFKFKNEYLSTCN